MIKHQPLLAAASLAALIVLNACEQKQPEVVEPGGPDPLEQELKKAPKAELPPAIQASRTYRCKDNSLVYVNFLTDGVSANVRDKEEEPPRVQLKAPAPGEAFVGQGPEGQGFKLSGSGQTVTYTSPDSGTQTCRSR